MALPSQPSWGDSVPLALLQLSQEQENRSIAGIVTLVWPYSVSRKSISLLLVESDFRLRRQKGQVRLNFEGSSAKAVANAGVQSGDRIRLSLEGVVWARDESIDKTPGRGIEWALHFTERLIFQFQRDGENLQFLDIDHPPLSPSQDTASPPLDPPHFSQDVDVFARKRQHVNGNLQAWASPAFLKRKDLSSIPIFHTAYDLFEDRPDYRETSPSKRTKFGRKSGEWKFADRSPSPVEVVEAVVDDDYGVFQDGTSQEAAVSERFVKKVKSRTGLISRPSTHVPKASNTRLYAEDKDVEKDGNLPTELVDDHEMLPRTVVKDSASQTLLPPFANVDPHPSERNDIAQDTRNQNALSIPGSIDDTRMELAAGNLRRDNHISIDAPPFVGSSPASSPASPNSVDLDRPSRQARSISNDTGQAEKSLTRQDSLMSPRSVASQLSSDESFSNRAYPASESSARTGVSPKNLELVGPMSGSSGDAKRYKSSTSNPLQQGLSVVEIPHPSPQWLDQGYDGSIFSRPQAQESLPPNTGDESYDSTTHAALHEAGLHVPASEDKVDSHPLPKEPADGNSKLNSESFLHLSADADEQLEVDYEEQQSMNEAKATSSPGDNKDNEPQSLDNADNRGHIADQGNHDIRIAPDDHTFNAKEPHSYELGDEIRSSSDVVESEYGMIENSDTNIGELYGAASDSEESALVSSLGVDKSGVVDSFDEEHDLDTVDIQDELNEENSFRGTTATIVSGKKTALDSVEIIDVDEYEESKSLGEGGDLAQSEEGDYWSHDELAEQGGYEYGSMDDDEFKSEEELRSAEEGEQFEDDELDYEDSTMTADVPEELGQGHMLRSDVKAPNIEIIDLESDDEVEPPTTAPDSYIIPQAGSVGQDTGTALATESAHVASEEESVEPMEVDRVERIPQPTSNADLDALEEMQESVGSPSKIRMEVRDTYSEDAALSGTDFSGTFEILQDERKPKDMQWSAKQSPEAAIAVQQMAWLNVSQVDPEEPISENNRQSPSDPDTTKSSNVFPEKPTVLDSQTTKELKHPLQYKLVSSAPEEGLAVSLEDSFGDSENPVSTEDKAYDSGAVPGHNVSGPKIKALVDHETESNERDVRRYPTEEPCDEVVRRSQLLTPNDTQTTKVVRGQSDVSRLSQDARDTFPTPTLTQRTSDLIPLSTPLPRKPSLIEQLKEMRSSSARKRQSLGQKVSTYVSPWFGISKSSRTNPPVGESIITGPEEETGLDGDVSSEVEQSELDGEPSLPKYRAGSPPMSSMFARLPSSSPPARPEPDAGFRTSLSYFAPLSTLRSHYNSTTSVLALVITSTPVTRATAGPKDYHMTLYVTDPSSSSPPSVTSARIFRPSKFPFPEAKQGDVILLRNFRVVSYRKQLGLLSTESSAWAVFRRGEEPQVRGPPVEFGAEERGFARGHWDWWGAIEQEKYTDALPSVVGRPRRDTKHARVPSGVVKHELRDGTTYVDRPKVEDTEMHELRDGTQYSDSKL